MAASVRRWSNHPQINKFINAKYKSQDLCCLCFGVVRGAHVQVMRKCLENCALKAWNKHRQTVGWKIYSWNGKQTTGICGTESSNQTKERGKKTHTRTQKNKIQHVVKVKMKICVEFPPSKHICRRTSHSFCWPYAPYTQIWHNFMLQSAWGIILMGIHCKMAYTSAYQRYTTTDDDDDDDDNNNIYNTYLF